jgi:CubicO group peptidase (beta-lactamase class C family)
MRKEKPMRLQQAVDEIILSVTDDLLIALKNPMGMHPTNNDCKVAVAVVAPPGVDLDHLYTNPHGCVGSTTSFAIGSLTKTFTATLLGYAANLDSSVFSFRSDEPPYRMGSFLTTFGGPGVSSQIGEMSLRMLAQHMAGFFDHLPTAKGDDDWGSVLFQGNPFYPPPTLTDFWAFYPERPHRDPYKSWSPGSCWNYSDIGFVTLGYALISQWPNVPSTVTYSDLLQILTGPLAAGAMPYTYTAWPPKHDNPPAPPPVVTSYYNGNQVTAADAPDIKSSIEDMWTWMNMNLNPKDFPDLTAALQAATTMFDPYQPGQQPNPCLQGTYCPPVIGLAWQPGKLTGVSGTPAIVWKDGASGRGGCSSWIGLLYESPGPLGVAILANSYWDTHDVEVQVDAYGHSILTQVANALIS